MEKVIKGALLRGTRLFNGKYTIVRPLGQGTTAITYLAEVQTEMGGELGSFYTNANVAIKEFFLSLECHRNETTSHVSIINHNNEAKVSKFKEAFSREATRIAQLNHPNIVHVSSTFEENGTVYYVMQYISGGSIREEIDLHGAFSPDRALRYATEIASALDYMHQKTMCHYDLKPGNIMLSGSDHAMLIDFGIAKNYDNTGQETSTTPPGLTKGFAPLEQYSSVKEFSPKIDVYSLGATLYNMLTGVVPPEPMVWVGTNNFTPKPDNVSNELWNIVRKAMSLGVKERPTMSELLFLLQNVHNPFANKSDVAPEEEQGEKTHYEELDNVSSSAGSLSMANGNQSNGPSEAYNHHAPAEQPVSAQPQPSYVAEDSNNGKSKKGLLFIGLAVAVGFIAAFLLAFFLFKGLGKTEDASKATTDTTSVTTIYDSKGQLICTFNGEVVNGQPVGNGTLKYINDPDGRDYYKGGFVNGLRESDKAILHYKNGDIYRGSFKENKLDFGTYYVSENGEYFRGHFKNDKPWKGIWYDKKDKVISKVEYGE